MREQKPFACLQAVIDDSGSDKGDRRLQVLSELEEQLQSLGTGIQKLVALLANTARWSFFRASAIGETSVTPGASASRHA